MVRRRLLQRPAFTACELVLVVAIIACLSALALPALQSIRHKTQMKETADKLRTMALAIHEVDSRYRKLPPTCGPFGRMKRPATIHVHLLPYVRETELF